MCLLQQNWNAERGTEILNTLLKHRKLDLVVYRPWQMKNILQWDGNTEKKPASIRPNAQNLILICTSMMFIIEQNMIHMIFSFAK